MALTVGVDIGGTKVLGGVVDPSGAVLARTRRDTPARDAGEILERTVEVIKELAATHPVEAVGIGAAGWIDAERATILFAPHLAWRNEPLRDQVAEAVDLPVVIENDASAAAWAEFRFGAGRQAGSRAGDAVGRQAAGPARDAGGGSGGDRSGDSMVLLTVGTGIGSGIILGGSLLRGAHGIAAEVGHTQAVPDGHACNCGRRGCLEQYASGTALVRFARAAAQADPDSAAGLLGLAGGVVTEINGPLVTEAARAADRAAVAAFDQIGYWLGIAMADLVQVLDPRVIVVGGGVAEAGDLLMRPARAAYGEALRQRGRLPVAEVVQAALGNTAGMVGAADLARRRRYVS